MDINDSSIHPHPLFLRENNDAEAFCFICRESIFGNPFYVSEDCKVYVHKHCAKPPTFIDHPFHPQHRLHLQRQSGFFCDSCHREFNDKPHFSCSTCNFDLDVGCALMPKIDPQGEELIQHFSHQHPMSLCSQDQDQLCCFACKDITSEAVYGCIPCEYFLHKFCSELPTAILHALHPEHALYLQVKYSFCQICKVRDHTFKFRCGGCDFSLHIWCWKDYTWGKEDQNLERECFLCRKQHLDSISCIDSTYMLHPLCIRMDEKINHQFHSHKPLQLLAPKDFWCDSCHRWFYTSSCYGCYECDFHVDVKCALMPMVQGDEGRKYLSQSLPWYFGHQHQLYLIIQDFGIICSVCQMTRPSPIYGCLRCEYFLHKSCIELPSEIKSALHSHHKLTLGRFCSKYCHLCLKKYGGFFFGCTDCAVYIGIECYSLIPKFNLQFPYHEHPLCLVEKSYCEKCDIFCGISKLSSAIRLDREYLLRCVECDYSVHLLCSKLPCTIKDKNHLHCLQLTESVVEDDCDDYYCDICEEERDPREYVYWCKDCDFVSHVHCVLSEILNAWKKDTGQAELKFASDVNFEEREYQRCYTESGKVMILKNVLDSLSEEERKAIDVHFPRAKLYEEDEDYSQKEDEDISTSEYEGSDIIQELLMHENMSFLQERIKGFDPIGNCLIQHSEIKLEVVEVEGYMITSNFASGLSALFTKYGDFSARARFRKNFKSVIFYLLIRTVYEMRKTCIADITERQLLSWHYYTAGAVHLGFDRHLVVPFMYKCLQSFSGLKVMTLEEELPNKVAREIADLESQIERRKSYLSGFKPGNDELRVNARKNKWRRAVEDLF